MLQNRTGGRTNQLDGCMISIGGHVFSRVPQCARACALTLLNVCNCKDHRQLTTNIRNKKTCWCRCKICRIWLTVGRFDYYFG
ncbi:hypothetical protein J4Q44_G00114750 [Coregonus suidteri]|uniref:Uncharacterized protein n=1 Tax=Coregonus suidteri TaxID=861788 RepID=A0AAN8QW78_9TELE